MTRASLLWLALLVTPGLARADEGMWTFDDFPAARVKEAYGAAPDAAWLERVRLSSVRLGNGCSGSFVSDEGLVLTNHHCALGCVQQLSTKRLNLVEAGFSARRRGDERRCPGLEINQLTKITDVTERVFAALEGKSQKAFADAKKATIAEIEKACATSEAVRCDVVSLYRGGRYHLYEYRRYDDVRLAFAPPLASAFFGGDPDNFEFPRYNLDFAFLRAYEGNKPVKTPHFLKWRAEGPKAGELVFVSGHPGSTERQLTAAQLAYQRDYALPELLMTLSELRGYLSQFSLQSKESARTAKSLLFRMENAYKAFSGRRLALVDDAFFAEKAQAEAELQRKVAADPKLRAQVGDAWGEIARAQRVAQDMRFDLRHMEPGRAYFSRLFGYARTLVRWAEERDKPDGERLPGYTEAKRPQLEAGLFAPRPVYPELEILVLTFAFDKMRRELGPDHEFVKAVLQKRSPRSLAEHVVRGSKLADPKVRRRLFGAKDAAILGSKDPMIQLAKVIDPFGRRVEARYENEVESVITKAAERIAAARFALYGTEVYPDATFSLRLSYGTVKGFSHLGATVEPFTTYAGLYARATGEPPFALPKAFEKAKGRIDMDQRLNLVTTNDIIGGNSGSPLIDADGQLVGLVFDGNIYSLGGAYGFDPRVNRTVAVHAGGLLHALERVWRAERLVNELTTAE